MEEEPEHNKERETSDESASKERIDNMRSRLYERGSATVNRGRTEFREKKPKAEKVRRAWNAGMVRSRTRSHPSEPISVSGREVAQKIRDTVHTGVARARAYHTARKKAQKERDQDETMPVKRKRSYRWKLMLFAGGFFMITLLIASAFLFLGNKSISGDNIAVSVEGPFAVGGGAEMPLEISIANNNSVPIESATLIIQYPPGTQSATDPGKELFSERLQLDRIEQNELVQVPVRSIAFGEENDDKTIQVSVEYRVRGSNATFYKTAEPYRYTINSSPVVLSVENMSTISSGQEAEIVLTVRSNSPTTLSDILIKAEYPFGFDFDSSSPATISGQDTWLIQDLEPEGEETITVRGVVLGKQDEDRTYQFIAGVPNERDRFTLASVFTTVTTETRIEQPFLDIGVRINNSEAETVAVERGGQAIVSITFKNTLNEALYDSVITAELEGNAIDDFKVNAGTGFFNSLTNTVRWDATSDSDLKEIAPGQTRGLQFTMGPLTQVDRTPEIGINIGVSSERVQNGAAAARLTGTANRTIRVESAMELSSETKYALGPFQNIGPIPPVIEELTQYTLSFTLKNGSNEVTGTQMTAVLPQYVVWLDTVTPGDNVSFNPSTRVVTWDIGKMDASETNNMAFQVSFMPSASQFEKVPVLLEEQHIKATDRFTGTVLRTSESLLTTILPEKEGSTEFGIVTLDEDAN